MPVRNQNWYDTQEGRRYPLDETSTGLDDAGQPIRDNIIVDCHMKFPEDYGMYAYVSGITVTGGIVTVVISSADSPDGENARVLGAVSVPKPIVIGRNYPIQPISEGVAGWFAFGSGCAENFSGKYSTPPQALLSYRNARGYRPLPVTSLGKYGLTEALTNVVRIAADEPVTATYTEVTINNKPAKAIVLGLSGRVTDADIHPLQEFLGPCGARPESGTCPKEPILSINGIRPDCAGNINISVAGGLTTYMFDECGGMGIAFPIGLAQTCPKEEINPDCTRTGGDGKPVGQGLDLCRPSSSTSARPSSSSSSAAAAQSSSSSSVFTSSSSAVCLALPYCKKFTTELELGFGLDVRFGSFLVSTVDAPNACESSSSFNWGDSSSSSQNSSSSSSTVNMRNVLRASSVTGLNVLTIKNCATDWAINQRIAATFSLGGGARRNGGVVVNYLTPAQTGNKATFIAALLDLDDAKFKLIRYNGTSIVTEYAETFLSANFVYDPAKWYTAAITPSLSGGNVSVAVELREFDTSALKINFNVALNSYGFVAGSAGIISNQAYTNFSHLTIGV